jgi:hypothetical protein
MNLDQIGGLLNKVFIYEHKILKDLDEAAIMWDKTKDPKYKELWYDLLKKLKYVLPKC